LRPILIPMYDGEYSKCEIYDVDTTNWKQADLLIYKLHQSEWNVTKCTNWFYDRNEIPYETIATEYNWVCDKAYYPTLAVAIYYVGAIIGGFIVGWVADHYGRMPALILCNMVGFVGGFATIFSVNFLTFVLCRLMVGFAYDNSYMMLYVIVLEYTGVKWRTFVSNMSIGIFLTAAMCLTPWIAIWSKDWRIFAFVTSMPLVLVLLTPLLVPESARWLMSRGRVKESVKIMKFIAKVNGKQIDDELFEQFEKYSSDKKAQEKRLKPASYSVLDLFKRPQLRTITILLCIMWMCTTFEFDGHMRNAGSIGLNIFVGSTIGSFTELPVDIFLVLILDKWGRRWPCAGSLVLGGIFSLLATLVPYGIYSASLAILGRATANFSFNVGCQYAAELLPTVVRGQGMAFIHIMGYVASILAPFVVYLANISKLLPLIILGLIGILGGCCCLFLPESLGCDLPQTLEDGDKLKNKKFFSFPSYGAMRITPASE